MEHTRSQPFNCGIFPCLFPFERIYVELRLWVLESWDENQCQSASTTIRLGFFSRAQLRDFSHCIRGSCNVSGPERPRVLVCRQFRFFVQLFIAYIWRIRHERHRWDRKHCNPVHATIHSFDGQHDSIHISIVRFHLEENLLFFFSMGAVGHFPHFLSVLRPCRKLRNIYRVQWHRFSLFGTAAAMCSQRIKFYVWTLHNRTAALKREGASRR